MAKPGKIFWDNLAKEDLRRIYTFNKENFSTEYAKKVQFEIYQTISETIFNKQWQSDEILGEPYRRMVKGHYKVVYKLSSNSIFYILMVFDTRQDPNKYKL